MVEVLVLDSPRHSESTFNPMPPAMDPLSMSPEELFIFEGLTLGERFTAEDYDAARATRAYGRGRRAKWAITTALALAAGDGPLPIGDTVAIVFLAAYAGYEIYNIGMDVLQPR